MLDFLSHAAGAIIGRYGELLFSDYDGNKKTHPVTIDHFWPVNSWRERNSLYIVDQTTADVYWNDDSETKRLKFLAIAFFGPLVHAIGLVANGLNRSYKVLTFGHLYYRAQDPRFMELAYDIARIALTPLIFIGLVFTPIYGLIRPNDGGKVYATLERTIYTQDLIAPCFQPFPRVHLGGGDPNLPNGW